VTKVQSTKGQVNRPASVLLRGAIYLSDSEETLGLKI
jgi:hypothetical protein